MTETHADPTTDATSERALCSVLLRDSLRAMDACHDIGLDHFVNPICRVIWQSASDCYARETQCNLIEVTTWAERGSAWKVSGSQSAFAAAVAEISMAAGTVAHVGAYVERLEAARVRREISRIGSDLVAQAQSIETTSNDLADQAEERIGKIRRAHQAEWVSMGDGVMDVVADLEAEYSGTAAQGLPTGLTMLDSITGGLQPDRLTVIAGRTSTGKSALASQIVTHLVVEQGLPVAVFSLEMSRRELTRRVLSGLSGVDLKCFGDRNATTKDFHAVAEAAKRLQSTQLMLRDAATLTAQAMRSEARRMRRSHGIAVVVVDYLQIMATSRRHDRHLELAEITQTAKGIAMELHLPVIMLSQLRRDAEANRPRLSHLKECGAIEEDADTVILVHRPDLQSPDSELIVAKNRGGGVGSVKAEFSGPLTRFEETGWGE